MSVNDIMKVIRDFYDNCGCEYDFDGLMDEADMIFKAARRDAIHEVAENTAHVIEMLYETYENMPLEGKVGLFDFRMDDANYNLSLHREVGHQRFGVSADWKCCATVIRSSGSRKCIRFNWM